MSNVQRGSKLLWVHCIMTWIVSLLVYSVRAPSPCNPAAWPALTPHSWHTLACPHAHSCLATSPLPCGAVLPSFQKQASVERRGGLTGRRCLAGQAGGQCSVKPLTSGLAMSSCGKTPPETQIKNPRLLPRSCCGSTAGPQWALRLRYLQQCEGAEARSVLVQDIPGAGPPNLTAQAGVPYRRLLGILTGLPAVRRAGWVCHTGAHSPIRRAVLLRVRAQQRCSMARPVEPSTGTSRKEAM